MDGGAAAAETTGILNLDKPAGWTSHDVVAKVRRLLGQKSVGHAGTLDPLATGVLLVCVGQATRVTEYLMTGRKIYRATIRLGLTTDTCDITGTTVATAPVLPLTRSDVEAALRGFVGVLAQTPPAFSAVKQAGVPAYRRARRGEAVSLAARMVTIYDIALLEWQSPCLTIEVTCDPGTYMRSLARDVGAALGCGAALAELRRLRSGHFTADDALSLDALAEAHRTGQIGRWLYPLAAALTGLTPVAVDAAAAARLRHGQPIPCLQAPTVPEGYAQMADGTVIAILRFDVINRRWQPKKVFDPMS